MPRRSRVREVIGQGDMERPYKIHSLIYARRCARVGAKTPTLGSLDGSLAQQYLGGAD